MAQIVITWHDRDGSNTAHEFAAAEEAEIWLRDVLTECCFPEDLERGGYTPDGIGMLGLYQDAGLDEVGTIELFVNNMAVKPEALRD